MIIFGIIRRGILEKNGAEIRRLTTHFRKKNRLQSEQVEPSMVSDHLPITTNCPTVFGTEHILNCFTCIVLILFTFLLLLSWSLIFILDPLSSRVTQSLRPDITLTTFPFKLIHSSAYTLCKAVKRLVVQLYCPWRTVNELHYICKGPLTIITKNQSFF